MTQELRHVPWATCIVIRLITLTLTVSWFMRRACSSGLHDNRETKVRKKHRDILYNQTVTRITFCFLTLTDPTAKAPKTHPELECLCFFPWKRFKTLVVYSYSSFQPNWFKNHEELPEQTWWVSDPSAWECPPRLRTCTWATDAGTAAGWRCGWTCAPSWSPRAGSLITTWYPAGRQKLQVYKKNGNYRLADKLIRCLHPLQERLRADCG